MSETVAPAPLEPVSEDWQRALAIVAHPDDLEFGAAAAIARWTRQGKQVVYCLVTSGEAGIDGLPPEETRPLRENEQRASAAVVGVDEVVFLGQPDGILEYGVPLRRDLARVIRHYRPDIVITNNFRATWDGAVVLNQADHIATGRATLDAVRDAGNRWVFPEQLRDDLLPWTGVKQVWAASSPDSRHGVDTTDTFDLGLASLRAHDAYLRGLGSGDFDAEEFLEGISRPVGSRLGTRYGTSFEVFQIN
ncbi:PIG-L deacetylase family protein [Micromonospora zhanjiangensis]|uniref:PIG-L deacetylase family protein n=1 Tax=Micromonospora zhanjiangensis TaxID=1522057 RepID=A0ABV8KNK7_9ACTN